MIDQKPSVAQAKALADLAQLAGAILSRLGEQEGDQAPFRQVYRALQVLGTRKVLAALEAALQIEAEGGLLTKDGARRRTPGGTFFYVLRSGISSRERWAIWGWLQLQQERREGSVKLKQPKAKQPDQAKHPGERQPTGKGRLSQLSSSVPKTDSRMKSVRGTTSS